MDTKEYRKQYYQQNRDKLLAKQKKYAAANKDSEKERASRWRRTKVNKNLWTEARKRAVKRGLDFDLVPEDIVLPTHCPYLGIALQVNQGTGFQVNSYSLDRIDNTKGYTKDNIEVISYLANSMKRNATKEELVAFAKEILRRYE